MRIDLYCFPSKLERQPSKCQNFEAQSHSLFSRCLRLATTITDSHPRLATGGWLDLTRQAFHLLDYSPLSGRTIPIFRSLRLPNKLRFFVLCAFPINGKLVTSCNSFSYLIPQTKPIKIFQFQAIRQPLSLIHCLYTLYPEKSHTCNKNN